ncbi:hypothetical protein ABZ345_37655 [Lentzea sp. NPDC005914]|uniref:glycosyltransferase n=1 Tax=Lentzea sp. NPDC005914 TaxID=3154572 RepID=UPI0033E7010C
MRILFEPLAGAIGLGAITRCLALSEQAVLRGHTVAFHAQPYPLVERHSHGPRFDAPVPTRPPGVRDPQSTSFAEAIHLRGLAEPGYLETAIAAELDTIDRFRPDVVVTEWQPTVPISAHIAGVPFAATLATTELAVLVGDPPDPAFRDVDATIASACRDHGVPEPGSLEELLHCTSVVNLAPTTELLEPMLASVPRTRYVGPLLFAPLELTPAPELPQSEVRVLVYVGAGAVKVRELLPVLAKAFPAPRHSVLVAARESSVDGLDTPFQHENITVAHEPGLTRALRDSDIVVARGSQNAVAACLLAGVPVIGTPGTRDSEPLFNMGVLEGHGVGRTILGTPTATDLADAADELLNGGAAHRAARLGDALRRHGGAVEAVRALEESVAGLSSRDQ